MYTRVIMYYVIYNIKNRFRIKVSLSIRDRCRKKFGHSRRHRVTIFFCSFVLIKIFFEKI